MKIKELKNPNQIAFLAVSIPKYSLKRFIDNRDPTAKTSLAVTSKENNVISFNTKKLAITICRV